MAGIYVHIPFCRRRCHYCDFYKTTEVTRLSFFKEALVVEAELQSDFLKGERVKTVYFGGGTPSLLGAEDVAFLMGTLRRFFKLDPSAEVSLEVNPDDVDSGVAESWARTGVNRLSIGIQSFRDSHLRLMNRRHTARQAFQAVDYARGAGFTDISIDLIYSIPGMTLPEWENNLDTALSLPVNHISAYHLTYHEGTPFFECLRKGTLTETTEEESLSQFDLLMKKTSEAGFEHYEISNFAKNGAYSRHNCGYWFGEKYLGLGPSAHSYNGLSRQWNLADLDLYLEALKARKLPFDEEVLSEKERLNDYLITRFRTRWGISLAEIRRVHGDEEAGGVFRSALPYLHDGFLEQEGDVLRLTPAGILISDRILLELIRE